MRPGLLNLLRCPDCRGSYREQGDRLHGYLLCGCRDAIPVLDGFAFFTEARPACELSEPGALEVLAARLFGTARQYEDYLREKQSRNLIEAYAAFQPFNESERALETLLPHIRPAVRRGGAILDTWCRTGWSGEWLAGLFPEQLIVSLWEGDSSVLGYRGFRRLLGSGQRPGNLEILFHHPGRPLPFADEVFDFVHAHDALHRFGVERFAAECLRVNRGSGAVVFAHVHLANSEPDPYFERGGTKVHGRDYRRWLDGLTAGTSRRGFVFSEAALFDGPTPALLRDDSDTAHYNGLIAILPQPTQPTQPTETTQPAQPATSAACGTQQDTGEPRYIVNPMFRLNLARRCVQLSRAGYDGTVGHYLLRHPAYTARLPEGPVVLDETGILALHLAAAGLPHESILSAACDPAIMSRTLHSLCRMELLFPACVSANAHLLQRVHASQYARQSESLAQDCFVLASGSDGPLIDTAAAGALSGRDVAEFAGRLASWLAAQDVSAGMWLEVCPAGQPLLWIAAVAAAAAGVNVRIAGECLPVQSDGSPTSDAATNSGTLRLCADEQPTPRGWLPLGLAGQAHSLLTQLQSMPAADRSTNAPGRDFGLIEVPGHAGPWRCPVAALAAGCAALRGQREPSLLILGERADPATLLTVLISLVELRPLQSV
ncbi:MAG TPA: class I SAM-dependent methyltransferase [Steroidobacteraceae bacterium]|nr:class I SAM-dependent methyltransferase [Steroidobacteraceae bacterium]